MENILFTFTQKNSSEFVVEQRAKSNEQMQKLTSNEQKVTNNEQKVSPRDKATY